MSYDVSIVCEHCNSPLGGYEGNYTYNLSNMFHWALEGFSDDDLHGLNGKSGLEVSQALQVAIIRCENDPDLRRFDPPNGWGDHKSAIQFLREMEREAARFPKGKLRVT